MGGCCLGPIILVNQMQKQLTLLDVCRLPDVQIHSKTGLFKYLVNRQGPQMLKLKENIVKLSYTNKIIGIKGDEVGITSKRLPLRFKDERNSPTLQGQALQRFVDHGFVAHKTFFVAPLPTVKKTNIEESEGHRRNERLVNAIAVSTQNQVMGNFEYKVTSMLRPRALSLAKLRYFEKKEEHPKAKADTARRVSIPKTKTKSFSNLLRQLGSNRQEPTIIQPLDHEESTLFRRIQHISQYESKTQCG